MMENVTSKDELMIRCGKRVRECRKEAGFTQEKLALEISLLPENRDKPRSEKQLSYIERGKRPLSIEYARLLSKLLKVREEYLLCEDDYKTQGEILLKEYKHDERIFQYIDFLIQQNGYKYISCFIPNWDTIDFSPHEKEIKSYSDLKEHNNYHERYYQKIMQQAKRYYEFKTPTGDTIECSHEDYKNALYQISHYAGFVMNALYQKSKDKPKKASPKNRMD